MSATWIALSAIAFLTAKNSPKLLVSIGQHSDLRQAIKDLNVLIINLTKRPTHVNKIVPHPPSVARCCKPLVPLTHSIPALIRASRQVPMPFFVSLFALTTFPLPSQETS
jgi:hypothetical protein